MPSSPPTSQIRLQLSKEFIEDLSLVTEVGNGDIMTLNPEPYPLTALSYGRVQDNNELLRQTLRSSLESVFERSGSNSDSDSACESDGTAAQGKQE